MHELFVGDFHPSSPPYLSDLHLHTDTTDGHAKPYQLVELAIESQRLDAIAVTDHHTIRPAVEAYEHAIKQGYPLEVIIGTEITTADGHVNALYVEDDIPAGLSLEDTLRKIHEKKGLAVAVHPLFMRLGRSSLGIEALQRIVSPQNTDPLVYFDGFEIYNGGIQGISPYANRNAQRFYLHHKEKLGAPLGSSDTHYFTPGTGMSGYAGSLRDTIEMRETTVFAAERSESHEVFTHAVRLFPDDVERIQEKLTRRAARMKSR